MAQSHAPHFHVHLPQFLFARRVNFSRFPSKKLSFNFSLTPRRVEDEDTQPLTEPIIKPIKKKNFHKYESVLPATTYKKDYLYNLTAQRPLIRNIALVGHLHHGKTNFIDYLVRQTHIEKDDPEKDLRSVFWDIFGFCVTFIFLFRFFLLFIFISFIFILQKKLSSSSYFF
jgi:hypothetical protein